MIYQRYIVYNILTPFLGALFIITGLVWLSQVIKMVYLIDRGIKFLDFIYVTILLLPSLLFPIIPLAIVISVIIAYNKLVYEREIIALSNSGLNSWKLTKPAILVAIIVTVFSYSISLYFLPISTYALKSNLNNLKNNYASSLLQDKTFTTISKNVILYVDQKSSNRVLQGIAIFDNRNHKKKTIIFAKSGSIDLSSKIPSLNLEDGMRQELDENGYLNKMHFQSLLVSLNNPKCDESDPLGKCYIPGKVINKDINECFLSELISKGVSLQNWNNKFFAEVHQRLVWPLMPIALSMLALSIFIEKPYSRRGNNTTLYKSLVAIVIVTGIHFFSYNAASKNFVLGIVCYFNIIISCILGYRKLNYIH